MARVTRSHDNGDSGADFADTFIVQDYVGEEDSEDGIAFYVGDRNGGYFNYYCHADAAEQVLSPEEVTGRKIPGKEEILSHIMSEVMSGGDNFSIHSADRFSESNEVEFVGTTNDGLEFAFTVQLTSLYEADY
jgi:hypothetical protein